MAAFVTLGVLIAAIIKFGIDGRFIGGNQPNIVSSIAFSGIIFSLMSGLKSRVILIAIFVLIIIMLNSRIYFLGSFLTLSIFYLKTLSGKVNLSIILVLPVLFLAGYLVSEITEPDSMPALISEFLALNDEERGLDSGMTGRMEANIIGAQLLLENPLIGYGYKTRGAIVSGIESPQSHSGLLNLALDAGLIGLIFFTFLTSFSYRKRRQLYNLTLFDKKNSYLRQSIFQEQVTNISAFPAYIILFLVEPTYLQVGLATNMLFLLFVLPQTAMTAKIN